MAYSATNFHSAVGAEFAQCVTTGTGGDLTLVTHPGGSLFAGGEIKRAVQTGQVNIGERLLSGHQNENILFGFDPIPFLATSFEDSERLFEAAKGPLSAALEAQNLKMLYSVPWPSQGLYFAQEVNSVADMAGIKFRAYNSATARLAELTGMLPVQIEAAEISQAFATGVASSMISSGATGFRVSLLLSALGKYRRLGEIWCFGIGTYLSWFFAYHAIKMTYGSYKWSDISQGQDATPMWSNLWTNLR